MKLIGRDKEIEAIEDCMLVHQCGMHPGDGPVGAFMLAGTTGSGKTRTIEYLAHKHHGNAKQFIKVDCCEYQLEHEVAKLIGAPPGYLGHRETVPFLTQAKLNAMTSAKCGVNFVLFDEIEKAAPSMQRLLLGVMDKAQLRLGDNSLVCFDKSLLFFTTNLGTKGLFRDNLFEFVPSTKVEVKKQEINRALRAHFAPEFLNRLTNTFVYPPLTEAESLSVVRAELDRFAEMLMGKFIGCSVIFDDTLVSAMFTRGFSREYGGRELKRTIHKHVVVPLARWSAENHGGQLHGVTVALAWGSGLSIEKVGPTVNVLKRVEKGRGKGI